MKCLVIILLFSFNLRASEFNKLLKEAVEKSSSYISIQAELENIKLDKLDAQGEFLPSFSLFSNEAKSQFADNDEELVKTYGGRLNYNLFEFGADLFSLKGQSQKVTQFENKLMGQTFDLESTNGKIIFNRIKMHKDIELMGKIIANKQKAVTIANKRFKAGVLSSTDLDSVKIDYYNAQAELADYEINFAKNTVEYKKLLVSDEVAPHWPWLSKSINKTNKDVESNYQLKIDKFELYSLENFKRSAIASSIGSLDFSLTRNKYETTIYDEWEWRSTLTLTIPLFDKFDDYTNYKKIVLRKNAVERAVQQKRVEIKQNFKTIEENLKRAKDTYAARKQTLKLSERVFRSILNRFKRGKISVNELLVEQNRMLRTQLVENQGALQLHMVMVDYCHSIGKSIRQQCFE